MVQKAAVSHLQTVYAPGPALSFRLEFNQTSLEISERYFDVAPVPFMFQRCVVYVDAYDNLRIQEDFVQETLPEVVQVIPKDTKPLEIPLSTIQSSPFVLIPFQLRNRGATLMDRIGEATSHIIVPLNASRERIQALYKLISSSKHGYVSRPWLVWESWVAASVNEEAIQDEGRFVPSV